MTTVPGCVMSVDVDEIVEVSREAGHSAPVAVWPAARFVRSRHDVRPDDVAAVAECCHWCCGRGVGTPRAAEAGVEGDIGGHDVGDDGPRDDGVGDDAVDVLIGRRQPLPVAEVGAFGLVATGRNVDVDELHALAERRRRRAGSGRSRRLPTCRGRRSGERRGGGRRRHGLRLLRPARWNRNVAVRTERAGDQRELPRSRQSSPGSVTTRR